MVCVLHPVDTFYFCSSQAISKSNPRIWLANVHRTIPTPSYRSLFRFLCLGPRKLFGFLKLLLCERLPTYIIQFKLDSFCESYDSESVTVNIEDWEILKNINSSSKYKLVVHRPSEICVRKTLPSLWSEDQTFEISCIVFPGIGSSRSENDLYFPRQTAEVKTEQ